MSSLPPLEQGFIDLHFNGWDAPEGKTTWGLVIDLQGSKLRWNLNAEKWTDMQIVEFMDRKGITDEEVNNLCEMIRVYIQGGYDENPRAYMIPGQFNTVSGTGQHRLKQDFRVTAILDASAGLEDPVVCLWWGEEVHVLDQHWYSPASHNPTIVARFDLKDLGRPANAPSDAPESPPEGQELGN